MRNQLAYYYRLVSSFFNSIHKYITSRSDIGAGAYIKNSKLGHRVRLGIFSTVENSTLHDNVHIGNFAFVSNSTLHRNVTIGPYSHILGAEIESYSYVGSNSDIRKASIGKFVSISWNVTIGPPEHLMTSLSTHPFVYSNKWGILPNDSLISYDEYSSSCEIGHDVWIGANAIILRGVKIGTGAVIGAGAVVTRDVPPYAVVVGVPARILKYRFSQEVIDALLKSKWWNAPPEKISKLVELINKNLEEKKLIQFLETNF